MKISVLLRWVGPAAIASGVFMVFSDLSGLPITVPYLSTASPTGYDAVGSGLILFALVLLLVGMVGLYAKEPAPDRARVIEYGEGYPRYNAQPLEELTVPEETPTSRLGKSARWYPRMRLGPARWSSVPGCFCSF